MANILPSLSPPSLIQPSRDNKPSAAVALPFSSSSSASLRHPVVFPVTVTASVNLAEDEKKSQGKDEFYVNLGLAITTLREDLPLAFTRDLNFDIYRDDITYRDPLSTFTGIENYRLIFWALRFQSRILFKEISLDVVRIWQPLETVILIRWNLTGVPRVPWESRGQFQGTSRYKLDRNGKIYEHRIDNFAFVLPLKPAEASFFDLAAAGPGGLNPTFLSNRVHHCSPSWIKLYQAVRTTLDDGENMMLYQDGFATCT